MLPLERILEIKSKEVGSFPNGDDKYFKRYEQIKDYLSKNVYKYIGAGTSAEDQGVYTDHSIDHFNEVILFAGKLLGIDESNKTDDYADALNISPYEIYITLVSILLHDAGNILGRHEHEKKTFQIFMDMGTAVCSDKFEAKPIASIAEVHGGKIKLDDGTLSKDTISRLNKSDTYQSITFRPKLIAALVRFADEICESRNRAARFLISQNALPKWSEVYHYYADSISSVIVDIGGECVNLKFEITKENVINTYGKGSKENIEQVYLIDEIFSRLEKMYYELHYCRRFMIGTVNIHKIRAQIIIYDEDMNVIENKPIELEEQGYPSGLTCLQTQHSEWSGEVLHDKYK
jgi:hypothetical protein